MSISSISFLLPSPTKLPAGGYKVIFEYANRLAKDGYQVHIVYAGSLFFAKKNFIRKIYGAIRYILCWMRGYSARNWFNLDNSIKEQLTFSLNYRHVPKTSIYICSTPFTAMYLQNYPIEDNRKFYFIQGYENWGGIGEETLKETYKFPIHKIVVSQWLGDIVSKENLTYTKVTNGFDLSFYKITVRPEERNQYQLAMVYSPIACKGFDYGWAAVKIVKKYYPDLQVEMFGTEPRPDFLPDWVNYSECPPQQKIVDIYNRAAIFIASSVQEGWGLTIGEAMLCGAAVACSDNKGYLEMARNNETALVSAIGDSKTMANNIIRLITDSHLRLRLAYSGKKYIMGFGIENSYKNFRHTILSQR